MQTNGIHVFIMSVVFLWLLIAMHTKQQIIFKVKSINACIVVLWISRVHLKCCLEKTVDFIVVCDITNEDIAKTKGVGYCIHKKYLLDWFACVTFVETSYIVCLSLNHCTEKKADFSRFSQESLRQIYSFQL